MRPTEQQDPVLCQTSRLPCVHHVVPVVLLRDLALRRHPPLKGFTTHAAKLFSTSETWPPTNCTTPNWACPQPSCSSGNDSSCSPCGVRGLSSTTTRGRTRWELPLLQTTNIWRNCLPEGSTTCSKPKTNYAEAFECRSAPAAPNTPHWTQRWTFTLLTSNAVRPFLLFKHKSLTNHTNYTQVYIPNSVHIHLISPLPSLPPCSHFLSGFVYTITKSRIICHIWFRTPYYHHQDQMNLVFHGSLMTLDNRSDLIRYIILSLIIALVLQFIWKPPQ